MYPEGVDLTPNRVLAIVKGEDDIANIPGVNSLPQDTALVVFRHGDGQCYALGRKTDWDLWKQAGYQCMGSVDLVRDLFHSAERSGIKEKGIPWHLLRDVECEERGADSKS